MNDRVTVEGELDMRTTSYLGEGTTVAASDDNQEDGEMETITLPDEADPDDLTDKQQRAIELAVANPHTSAERIDEKIGSTKYAYRVLKDKVPEWYETVFKARGDYTRSKSQITQPEDVLEAIRENAPISQTELEEKLGVSKATISKKTDQIPESEYEVKQGVDGYHHRSKVYTLPENSESNADDSEPEVIGLDALDEEREDAAQDDLLAIIERIRASDELTFEITVGVES